MKNLFSSLKLTNQLSFNLKKLLPLFLILGILGIGNSQNALRSGDGWGAGWSTNDYFTATGFGCAYGKTYKHRITF